MRVSYIGDELSATGLALAGAHAHVAPADAEALWAMLLELRPRSDLVILSQDHAAGLGERLAELLATAPLPPVVLMPSLDAGAGVSRDTTSAARRQLGLLA